DDTPQRLCCVEMACRLQRDWDDSCLHGHVMTLRRTRTRLREYSGFSGLDSQVVLAIIHAAHELALPGLDKMQLRQKIVMAARWRFLSTALRVGWILVTCASAVGWLCWKTRNATHLLGSYLLAATVR
ncbi:unnamed protein product, partial [Symbiodinium necroappetens]